MDYNQATYFKELEQNDVKGFTVLHTSESEGYHIAEKWLKSETGANDVWLDYWIPAAQLEARVEAGKCEPVGELSDKQFAQVCDLVGWDYAEAAEASV